MKKFIVLLAMVLLTVASATPALAQQTQAPKGTEGPDIRRQEPKGTEGPDIRRKKETASAVAPKGTEGPDIRRQAVKGTEGPDVRKTEQKQAQ
jgi:hypothetical protein